MPNTNNTSNRTRKPLGLGEAISTITIDLPMELVTGAIDLTKGIKNQGYKVGDLVDNGLTELCDRGNSYIKKAKANRLIKEGIEKKYADVHAQYIEAEYEEMLRETYKEYLEPTKEENILVNNNNS